MSMNETKPTYWVAANRCVNGKREDINETGIKTEDYARFLASQLQAFGWCAAWGETK